MMAPRGYTDDDLAAVESPEATDEELAQARPFAEALPDLYAAMKREPAPPPREPDGKAAVTLRLDPDVLVRFAQAGTDWRARMAQIIEDAAPAEHDGRTRHSSSV